MWILERISHFLNQILIWIAGCSLAAMILLTCTNIFLRIFWTPVIGTFELMGYFGAVVTAFALGYTQVRRGHIAVDIVVLGFSKKIQKILKAVNYLICLLFFAIVAWQIAKYATTLMKTGEITETLRIIYYPFTYGVAFGCVILSLVFLVDFLKSFVPEQEDKE
jgi:TRAP-type C4-dicarboxylate transport system permease small subunit